MAKALRPRTNYFYIFVNDVIVLNEDVSFSVNGEHYTLRKGYQVANDGICSISKEQPVQINSNCKRVSVSSSCVLIQTDAKKQVLGKIQPQPVWIEVPVNILCKRGGDKTYPRLRGWHLD